MFALKNLIQIISLTQQHWNPYYPFKSLIFTDDTIYLIVKKKKIVLCFFKNIQFAQKTNDTTI